MGLYDTLGVEADADGPAIKKAYRKKAKQAHPDVKGGSEEAFHEVTRAYLVLSDPKKRSRYDKTGSIDDDAQQENSAPLQMISKVFQVVMEQYLSASDSALLVGDCIDVIRQTIQDENLQVLKFVEKRKRDLKRLEHLAKRFHKKSDGDNIFHQMIKFRTRLAAQDIENGQKGFAVGKQALVILSEYSFDTDKMAPEEIMHIMRNFRAAPREEGG